MKEISVTILLCVVSISLSIKTTRRLGVRPDDDVTLEDLKTLGADCEADNCLNATYERGGLIDRNFYDWSAQKCDCGALCLEYNTCCVDSPYKNHRTNIRRRRNREVCVQRFNQEVYFEPFPNSFLMIDECCLRWVGDSQIRDKCHDEDISDPFTLAPAFDHKNNVTYKNIFCGICNGVKPESLTPWKVKINAGLHFSNYTNEEVVENLTYSERHESWGHWCNSTYGYTFHNVWLTIDTPDQPNLKPCVMDLIETCDPAWTNETVLQKCRSYMAPIYAWKIDGPHEHYRNIHCAFCNYAELDPDNVCSVTSFGGGDGYVPPISFALLLDVNPRDGAHVGKVDRCKAGESYDSFFKKCRSLVCGIPGYVLKNNKCARL